MNSHFWRFALVGTLGFIVDTLVLYLLLGCSLSELVSRLGSFTCAAWVTWRINRHFTFVPTIHQSALREWTKYLFAMSGGGLVNLSVYTLIISSFSNYILLPAIAVGAGSLVGMTFNFISAKFWVFRSPKEEMMRV